MAISLEASGKCFFGLLLPKGGLNTRFLPAGETLEGAKTAARETASYGKSLTMQSVRV